MLSRLLCGFALVSGCLSAQADDADNERVAVGGRWATQDSILEVAPLGADSLSMRIVALRNPLYLPDEDGPVGTPRVDRNNPEEGLRTRSILGLELLADYGFSKGRWRGTIYDPESGNVYKSTMHVEDGELRMRGYIGVPMLGRTQTFTPVASCTADIREMIQVADLSVAECD